MTETLSIYHRTYTTDAEGGQPSTIPDDPSSTTVCRRVPIKSTEQVQGGATALIDIANFQVPYDADIESTDLLKVGSDSFEVTGIIDREPYISKLITCTRIP